MLVNKLIEELKKFDGDKDIKFVGIIESGYSVSFVEVESCILEEEDGVVFLKVSGEEESWK